MKRRAITITLHNGLRLGPTCSLPADSDRIRSSRPWRLPGLLGPGPSGSLLRGGRQRCPHGPSLPWPLVHLRLSSARPPRRSSKAVPSIQAGAERAFLIRAAGSVFQAAAQRNTESLSAVTEMWPSFVILLLVWDCCYSQYYFVVFFNVLTTLCQQRWDVSSHSPHAHGLRQLQQPLPSGAPCVRACVEVLMSCSLLDHWF